MKLYKILFSIIAATSLIACTPEVKETTPKDAQGLVDGLTYAKAKNGLCFGVVTVKRSDSAGHAAINQMVTHVPCKEVGL